MTVPNSPSTFRHFYRVDDIRRVGLDLVVTLHRTRGWPTRTFKIGDDTAQVHIGSAMLVQLLDEVAEIADGMRETSDSIDLRLGRDEQ